MVNQRTRLPRHVSSRLVEIIHSFSRGRYQRPGRRGLGVLEHLGYEAAAKTHRPVGPKAENEAHGAGYMESLSMEATRQTVRPLFEAMLSAADCST